MTDERKTAKMEALELNRETIQDLTEQEGEQARGGLRGVTNDPNACARAGYPVANRGGLSNDPPACALAGAAGYGGRPSNDPAACG